MRAFLKTYLPWSIALILIVFVVYGHGLPLGAPHFDGGESSDYDIDETYQFIRPLLNCTEGGETTDDLALSIEQKVTTFIEGKKRDGTLTEAAVYYRDLNNGPWFGINQDKKYFPASIHKVPLAMVTYQLAEKYPEILQKEIQFTQIQTDDELYFPPTKKLKIGESYTVEYLVSNMLQQSDNQSIMPLAKMINIDKYKELYADLGVTYRENEIFEMSSRELVRLFRIIYNATYLEREYSEKILEILSGSSFNQGLRAGVPERIKISHKFGEYSQKDKGQYQLHDCGIVYARVPYALCIMTEGPNMLQLPPVIAGISSIVYKEISGGGVHGK